MEIVITTSFMSLFHSYYEVIQMELLSFTLSASSSAADIPILSHENSYLILLHFPHNFISFVSVHYFLIPLLTSYVAWCHHLIISFQMASFFFVAISALFQQEVEDFALLASPCLSLCSLSICLSECNTFRRYPDFC